MKYGKYEIKVKEEKKMTGRKTGNVCDTKYWLRIVEQVKKTQEYGGTAKEILCTRYGVQGMDVYAYARIIESAYTAWISKFEDMREKLENAKNKKQRKKIISDAWERKIKFCGSWEILQASGKGNGKNFHGWAVLQSENKRIVLDNTGGHNRIIILTL